MSDRVEIHIEAIAWIGRAVADMAVMVGQPSQQPAHLGGERMFATVAGAVQPPDLSRRCFRGERVQHRKHRRYADAGTQQDDGPRILPQRETSARRADLHSVANLDLVGDILARRAVGFALDADAPGRGIGAARQRIAARHRRCSGGAEPHDDELPGQGGGDRMSVRGFEDQRRHVAAFGDLARDAKRPEAAPGRRRARRRAEPGVSAVVSLRCCSSSASKE